MSENTIVLMGCGDIGPVHEPMESYGALARPILATADIRFGQCERTYSEYSGESVDATIALHRGNRPLKPQLMSIFTDNAFDVVSIAGNHIMDWGEKAVLDTKELFRKRGIQAVGAGRNLKEAQEPAIVERRGVRVAILAYCSILKKGAEAGSDKVGIAPLRAHTSYEPFEYQAGTPPRIITTPDEEDLQRMLDAISKAKKQAHVVVLSLHWGIHHVPRMIADYQTIAAKAAFKAGADLILGHHAHVPKAIEVHEGKVCFYSLGNFMFSTNTGRKSDFFARMRHHGVTPDYDEAPNCPHGKDSKHSLIAKALLSTDGVKKVSFLPVQIDHELRPHVLNYGDPRFETVVNYLEWASDGYNHQFTREGNEIVVS